MTGGKVQQQCTGVRCLQPDEEEEEEEGEGRGIERVMGYKHQMHAGGHIIGSKVLRVI